MEGIGHPRMEIPLSIVDVMYSTFQQASSNPNLAPPQELYLLLKPIWAQESLASYDPLDLVFPFDEAILEAMTRLERPLDELHHISYFLPELKRIKVGEFVTTMNRDALCPINPMTMHKIYAEGNMKSIAKTIPIDIYRTPDSIENVFIGADCSLEEIQIYTELFKEFHDVFA